MLMVNGKDVNYDESKLTLKEQEEEIRKVLKIKDEDPVKANDPKVARLKRLIIYNSNFLNWLQKEQTKFHEKYFSDDPKKKGVRALKLSYPQGSIVQDRIEENRGKPMQPAQRAAKLDEDFVFVGDEDIKGDNMHRKIQYYDDVKDIDGKPYYMCTSGLLPGSNNYQFKVLDIFDSTREELAFFLVMFSKAKLKSFVIENKEADTKKYGDMVKKEQMVFKAIYEDIDVDTEEGEKTLRKIAKANDVVGVDNMSITEVQKELHVWGKAPANIERFLASRKLDNVTSRKADIREAIDKKIIMLNPDEQAKGVMAWCFVFDGKCDTHAFFTQTIHAQPQMDALSEFFIEHDDVMDKVRKMLSETE